MYIGSNIDFDSTPQTVTITAGASSSTIQIRVISDDIVESNEFFNMSLTVPFSLTPGITVGNITSATATIISTNSTLYHYYIVVCIALNILQTLQ